MERTIVCPRVFLAGDHSDLLEAEIALLHPHFELVGTAGDGYRLYQRCCASIRMWLLLISLCRE